MTTALFGACQMSAFDDVNFATLKLHNIQRCRYRKKDIKMFIKQSNEKSQQKKTTGNDLHTQIMK